MNLDPIFEENKRYSPSELAEIFDVSRQTIRNWALDDRLDYRENGSGREFLGHEVMRSVKQSDFLRKRLRKAHGVDGASQDDDYIAGLEDTIDELKDTLDEKDERIQELQDEKEQREEAIFDLIEGQKELREELQTVKDDLVNRLPEPDENDDKGGWFSWFSLGSGDSEPAEK